MDSKRHSHVPLAQVLPTRRLLLPPFVGQEPHGGYRRATGVREVIREGERHRSSGGGIPLGTIKPYYEPTQPTTPIEPPIGPVGNVDELGGSTAPAPDVTPEDLEGGHDVHG